MGDSLTPEMRRALSEELQTIKKEAGLAGTALRGLVGALGRTGAGAASAFGQTGAKAIGAPKAMLGWAKKQPGQLREAGSRLMDPVGGLRKGWRELTPATQIAAGERKAVGHLTKEKIPLKDIALGKAGPRAKTMAEELSRRGWTGEGAVTKYLPVGMKGMQAGFMGMSVPEIVAASKRPVSPTGEGGLSEAIGEHGLGNLTFLSAGRLGMLPAMAMYMAASKAGGGAGRIIDRLRGGATLPEAMTAPSPEEARQQLSEIQRYYG